MQAMAWSISFNGEPQAEANSGNDACGLAWSISFNRAGGGEFWQRRLRLAVKRSLNNLLGLNQAMFPSAAGFIPVEIRLLHYRDFHLKSKSALVQRPESTGVNLAGSLV